MDRKFRLITLIAGIAIPAAMYLGLTLHGVNDANATNDAFKNTKHGGGTVDGVPFSGVDRGVNPDYGVYYNNITTEAGQYQAGECVQCHEAHASFGGSEPAPASGSTEDPAGGPNSYLGMADTTQDFCWYCHESMNYDPMLGGGTGYYKFYQGKAKYQSSSHYNSATMKNPGFGAGSPWARTDRSTNLQSGHCLQCHTPHGIKGSAGTVYDDSSADTTFYAGLSAAKQAALTVPYLIPRQLIAFEEKLCINCHDADGPSVHAVKDDIKKVLPNSGAGPYAAGGSGHAVWDTDEEGVRNSSNLDFGGRHDLKNEANPISGSWNSESNNSRHVECVDCHNPHVAQSGSVARRSGEGVTGRDVTIGPVQVGGPNKGVWGVSVNTATGVITGKKQTATYIYEICLKCHSKYADSGMGVTSHAPPSVLNRTRWDRGAQGVGDATTHVFMPWDSPPGTIKESDIAEDYKTSHDAYHPVFALGKYQPPSTANPRWGNSQNCCGSCASPVACTISGDGLTVTNATLTPSPPEEFAEGGIKKRGTGKRLGVTGFANNFVPPWGPSAYVTCVDCHQNENEAGNKNFGPHGSSRPFILRKLDTGITYTIENDTLNQVWTGQRVVSYSNFSYGINVKGGNGTYLDSFIGTVNLEAWDPNNLCLNCHRADVYGFYRQSSAWSSGASQASCGNPYPRFRYLSRQPHPADGGCSGGGSGKGNSFDSNNEASGAGYPPRGIICIRCHGGNAPGAIHGNDSFDGPGGKARLLYGTVWTDYTPGTTTVKGSCVTGGNSTAFNACTHGANGNFDTITMYNY